MNPCSVDIKDMLVAESLSLVFATNLFIGLEPAKPNDCVTIFDTGGSPPQLNLDSSEKYEYPTLSIRVRNTNYETGWTLTNDIRSALHGRAHETWNGTYYSLIASLGDPMFLDWDENKRVRFIINFNLQRR